MSHLTEFALAGNTLRGGDDFLDLLGLPVERQVAALSAFSQIGTEKLHPIYERLGGTVTYDELKVLRLHYLSHLPKEEI